MRKSLLFFACLSIVSLIAFGNGPKNSKGMKVSSMENSVSGKKRSHTKNFSRIIAYRELTLQKVMNELQDNIPGIQYDSIYCSLSKKEVLNLDWINKEQIEELYEFTLFTEAYKLKLNDRQYLIIQGEPAGATGIGVDYKQYECFEFGNDKPIFEFSSLYGGPFSLFYNKELNNVGYWELTKERPPLPDTVEVDPYVYVIMQSAYTNGNCIHQKIIDKGTWQE